MGNNNPGTLNPTFVQERENNESVITMQTGADKENAVPVHTLSPGASSVPKVATNFKEKFLIEDNNLPNVSDIPKVGKAPRTRYLGIFFAILLSLFVSLTPLMTKLVIHIHPVTQTIYRQVGTTSFATILVVFLKIKGEHVFKQLFHATDEEDPDKENTKNIRCNWILIGKTLLSAVIAVTVTTFRATAFLYLTIADGTVLTKIYIVYALLLAHFFLGENCSVVQSILAFAILIGVIIISKPPFLTGGTEFTTPILSECLLQIGFALKLGDGFFQAISAIFIRNLRELHFGGVILIFGIIGLITTSILAISFDLFLLPTNLYDIGILAGLSFFHFSAQICQILALKYEHVGVVSLIQTLDVVLVYIWQITILHVPANIWSLIGTAIVISSVLVSSFRKILMDQPKSSTVRQKFRFLLK